MSDELQAHLDALDSGRGAESIDEMVERLDESKLTKSEIQEMVKKMNERNATIVSRLVSRG